MPEHVLSRWAGGYDGLRGAQEVFDRAGLRAFSPDEEQSVSHHFSQEMIRGLERRPSSVKMYRSETERFSLASLREGAEALVIEVGGTNRYLARVRVESGELHVLENHTSVLPVLRQEGALPHFESSEHFFDNLTEGAEDVLHSSRRISRLDALAVVYSFPGTATRTDREIDVMSPRQLTKNFVIPGIDQEPVGQALLRHLADKFGFSQNMPVAVLNDTVAVLHAAEAKLGGIVGTGYNLAMETPEGIVNAECGGFALRPSHDFARLIDFDSRTGNVGLQYAEKQVGGWYLGQQMEYIIYKLAKEGLISRIPENISSKLMSQLISSESQAGDVPVLREASILLRDRAADVVKVMMATAILTFPTIFTEPEFNVPIEGSLFWGMPGLLERVKEGVERMTSRKINFVNIENAGRKGAAGVALKLAS